MFYMMQYQSQIMTLLVIRSENSTDGTNVEVARNRLHSWFSLWKSCGRPRHGAVLTATRMPNIHSGKSAVKQ